MTVTTLSDHSKFCGKTIKNTNTKNVSVSSVKKLMYILLILTIFSIFLK